MTFVVNQVQVEVEVKPTEDPSKVQKAVERLFGDMLLKKKNSQNRCVLHGKTNNEAVLAELYHLFRRELICDAARKVLFNGVSNNSIVFYFNKQAAYSGHISFSNSTAESPLGPIKVEIICDNPNALIKWLAPKTVKGRAPNMRRLRTRVEKGP